MKPKQSCKTKFLNKIAFQQYVTKNDEHTKNDMNPNVKLIDE